MPVQWSKDIERLQRQFQEWLRIFHNERHTGQFPYSNHEESGSQSSMMNVIVQAYAAHLSKKDSRLVV